MSASLPEIIALPGGPARVEWRRNARARRISLRIDPRLGHIVVTLPTRAARSAGMALLMDHAAWVAGRLAALPGAVPFADGALLPLHGTPHRVHHDRAAGGVAAAGGVITVGGGPEFLARRIADFLRAEARGSLSALARQKASEAALSPRRISIKDTRSRWGSCTADRCLAFSWRLVMAPPFVQDYVAAHEVAHLAHMNHGPQFWALVNRLTPHRKAAILWLKRYGPGLLRVGADPATPAPAPPFGP